MYLGVIRRRATRPPWRPTTGFNPRFTVEALTNPRRTTLPTAFRNLILALFVLALTAATANATPTPKRTFVARVDGLCVAEIHAEAKVKQPHFNPATATAKDMPAGARYLGALAPIVGRFATNARNLGAPTSDAATYKKLTSTWAALAASFRRGASAAAKTNTVGFRRAVATSFTLSGQADKLAKQFGATRCAG
jgi:hypothetical protein